MNAVIALNTKNKGNFKNPPPIGENEHGAPICPGGYAMIHAGFYDKDRCRIKWHCPVVLGKCSACEACQYCSDYKCQDYRNRKKQKNFQEKKKKP